MESIEIEDPINVYGESLQPCSVDPMTGFFRDGCCNTNVHDQGSHTVCIEVTSEFLEYSRFQGNDLSTPVPEFGFPGLQPGDRWCLCAERWLEAQQRDMAPKIFLQSTHIRASGHHSPGHLETIRDGLELSGDVSSFDAYRTSCRRSGCLYKFLFCILRDDRLSPASGRR